MGYVDHTARTAPDGRTVTLPLRTVRLDVHRHHRLRWHRRTTPRPRATTDSNHLLNACATKMSALEDDPDHLLRWVRALGLDVTGADYASACRAPHSTDRNGHLLRRIRAGTVDPAESVGRRPAAHRRRRAVRAATAPTRSGYPSRSVDASVAWPVGQFERGRRFAGELEDHKASAADTLDPAYPSVTR
ncbi:FAD/NAD(P)-binding protein [Spirillospora sp. CA-128828]|uniref:FAD/NAD(P)-binding protein n=1 Tax=Spirillospora sp. CA-128828 TaxID=3240033 RepID=UPI003D901254